MDIKFIKQAAQKQHLHHKMHCYYLCKSVALHKQLSLRELSLSLSLFLYQHIYTCSPFKQSIAGMVGWGVTLHNPVRTGHKHNIQPVINCSVDCLLYFSSFFFTETHHRWYKIQMLQITNATTSFRSTND